MKAQCGVCLTDYTIDDAKVMGRVAKIRCTKCQGVVVVDGTKLTAAGARATGAMPVQPTPSGSVPIQRQTAVGIPAQPAPPSAQMPAQQAPMVKPVAGIGSKFDAPAAPVSDPQRVALANTLDVGGAATLPVAPAPPHRDPPRDSGSPAVNVGPKAFAQTMPPTAAIPAVRPSGQQPVQPPPMPRPSAQQPVVPPMPRPPTQPPPMPRPPTQPPPMPAQPRPSAQQPVVPIPRPSAQQPVASPPPPMPPPPTPRPRAPTMSPTAGIPAVRPEQVAQATAQQPAAQPPSDARPMLQAHRPARPSAPPPVSSMPSHVAVPAPKPIPPRAAAAPPPTPQARRERAPRTRPQKAGLPQFRPRNVTALARSDASLPFAPRVPRDATVAAPKVDFDVPIEFNFEGHYDVLGVPRAATAEEVKKAAFDMFGIYDRRARKGGDETATQRLQKVNEAQDVLGKPDKRAKYDRESEALFLTIQDPYPYERVAWNDGLDMIRDLTMSASDADPMRAIDAKIDDKERPNALLDQLLGG